MALSVRLRAVFVAAFLVVVLAGASAFADTYHVASFSGGVFGGNANAKAPFNANGITQGMVFSGSFVYDDQLVPAAGSGFVNVLYSSFPDSSLIPDATAFNMPLGPLAFTLGGATYPAAIQYNNGHFNGFSYVSDFTFLGNPYELSIQGGTWGIVAIQNGFPTFSNLVSGYINIGDAAVTNKQVYTPQSPTAPVPEPASLLLLGTGLAATARQLRKRGR
jgi:hypothetical protein